MDGYIGDTVRIMIAFHFLVADAKCYLEKIVVRGKKNKDDINIQISMSIF